MRTPDRLTSRTPNRRPSISIQAPSTTRRGSMRRSTLLRAARAMRPFSCIGAGQGSMAVIAKRLPPALAPQRPFDRGLAVQRAGDQHMLGAPHLAEPAEIDRLAEPE